MSTPRSPRHAASCGRTSSMASPRLLDSEVRLNETRLELSFPNGSKITPLGADRGAEGKQARRE